MIIKLTQDTAEGTWALWATEKDDVGEAPIYMGRKRSGDQIMTLVRAILDDQPERPAPPENVGERFKAGALAEAKRDALKAVLEALDGWMEGAQSNHERHQHRDNPGDCYCFRVAPADICNMIEEAAREIGLIGFSTPTNPPEDKK